MQQQFIRTTSVNNVQQKTYSVNSLPCWKRPQKQTNSDPRPPHVFNNGTDITSALNHHKRQRLDSGEENSVKASEIFQVDRENLSEIDEPKYPCERAVCSTPGSTVNPLLSLEHPCYGLPATLVKNLSALGISTIYPWQSSCLLGHGLLNGEKNLVYTAPTGGGKSLVADVLMLKRIIDDRTKKAILVLPYVALVQEKLKWLRRVVEGVKRISDSASQPSLQLSQRRKRHVSDSIRVVGFFGGSKTRVTWSDVDVAVCTIEKVLFADSSLIVMVKPSANSSAGKLFSEHSH